MPSLTQDRRRLPSPLRVVRGDPYVQRTTRTNCGVQRAHRLLEWRVRVEAMGVEDVDVVKVHPRQRLVQRRKQVLAGAPLSVRSGPHVVAGLGRDHQLVAVRPQVVGEHPSEVDLGRPVRWAVVVGEIEMGDPDIEGASDDRPLPLVRPVVAEVVPQPKRQRWQFESAAAAPPVRHRVVAVAGRDERTGSHQRNPTSPVTTDIRAPCYQRPAMLAAIGSPTRRCACGGVHRPEPVSRRSRLSARTDAG